MRRAKSIFSRSILTVLAVDGPAAVAAQRRARPRQQFGHAERLHHVIVGAEFEQAHLLGLVGAHRQHDHGHADHERSRSSTSAPSRSGRARSRIIRSSGRRVAARRPSRGVRRLVDDEPLELEPGAQEAPDLHLVVDDEHDGWLRQS